MPCYLPLFLFIIHFNVLTVTSQPNGINVMSNMKKKDDGKIRDVDIRLRFIERNIKFFEQPGFEFVNEFGINSTNVVDLAAFDFNHMNEEKAENISEVPLTIACFIRFKRISAKALTMYFSFKISVVSMVLLSNSNMRESLKDFWHANMSMKNQLLIHSQDPLTSFKKRCCFL